MGRTEGAPHAGPRALRAARTTEASIPVRIRQRDSRQVTGATTSGWMRACLANGANIDCSSNGSEMVTT